MKDFVLVGLGNPGKQYEETRHNVGFIVIESLIRSLGFSKKEESRFNAYVAKGRVEDATFHLLMPLTYMNESGVAVRKYLDFYKLQPDDVLIVCDDADLPFGKLRLREKGSSGGHNGLRSIEQHLGTREYLRLRVGVGRGVNDEDLVDYVLGRFTTTEKQGLDEVVKHSVDLLKRVPSEERAQLMNRVNPS